MYCGACTFFNIVIEENKAGYTAEQSRAIGQEH